MNPLELRAATSIATLFLVRMLGLFMVLPVLPLVSSELHYATPFLIGVAVGAYGFTQAVLQIPMGLLSDRFGRKNIITLGLLMFVAGSLVAAVSDSVYGVIAGRLLQGCGAIASSLFALISDLTRVEHRSKAMAIIGIGIAASFGISIVIGPMLSSSLGLSSLFYFSAVTGLAGVVLLWTSIPTPTIRRTNLDTRVVTSRLRSLLGDRQLLPATTGVFVLHYMLTSGFLVFPSLLLGIGIDLADHGIHYLGVLILSAVLMAPLVWLSDRQHHTRPVMLMMIVLLSLALGVLSTVSGYLATLVGLVLFFVAFNQLEVQLPAYLSRVVPAGERGTGMGVYATCQFLGTFAGGVAGGLLLSTTDATVLLSVNALICLVWFIGARGLSELSQIESRTYVFGERTPSSAKLLVEELLSVQGVLDVVVLESENVAYAKVDARDLDEDAVTQALERTAGE